MLDEHRRAGTKPRTLVMNVDTFKQLIWEVDGRWFKDGYLWWPNDQEGKSVTTDSTATFYGIPVLVKDFIPDHEVIVGV